jgi:hypothetical protein
MTDRRGWLTTATVARMVERSPRWVRWLARHDELPCELTDAGQRLFRRDTVMAYLERRARVHQQSRHERLAALRPKMLRCSIEPRQLSLFGTRRSGERSLPEAEANGPAIVRKFA